MNLKLKRVILKLSENDTEKDEAKQFQENYQKKALHYYCPTKNNNFHFYSISIFITIILFLLVFSLFLIFIL